MLFRDLHVSSTRGHFCQNGQNPEPFPRGDLRSIEACSQEFAARACLAGESGNITQAGERDMPPCQTKQWLAGAPSFFVSPQDLIDRCPSEPGLSIRGVHLQDCVKVGEGEIELMRILAYSCSQ